MSATQNCAGLTSAARNPSKLGGPSHSRHRWPRRDRLGDRVPRCRADPRSTEHSTTSWCPAAQRPGQDSGLTCRRRVWLAKGPCPASLAPAAGARAERENDCPARGWLCGAGKATWSEEEKVGKEAETYVTVALGTCAARDSPEDRSHTREDGAVLGTPFLVPKRIHTGSQRVPQQPRRVSCEWSRKLPDHRAQQRLGDGMLLCSAPEGCARGAAAPSTSVEGPGRVRLGPVSPPRPGLPACCAASISCVNAAAGHAHVPARGSLTGRLSGPELCPGSPHRRTEPGQLTGGALRPWLRALPAQAGRADSRASTAVLGGSLACSPPGGDRGPRGGRVCSGPRVALSLTPAPAWGHAGAFPALRVSSRGGRHPWVLKSGSVPPTGGLWPVPRGLGGSGTGGLQCLRRLPPRDLQRGRLHATVCGRR